VSDTGSIERFRGSIPSNYFRHAQGVVLIYDLTDPTSLYDLEDWMTDSYSKTSGDGDIVYTLIGNKLDQYNACDVGANSGKTFCARHAIPEKLQFQTSAFKDSRESLLSIFEVLAREIYTMQMDKEPVDSQSSSRTLLLIPEEEVHTATDTGKKGCYC
jgi:GTPase SAR1 family protein